MKIKLTLLFITAEWVTEQNIWKADVNNFYDTVYHFLPELHFLFICHREKWDENICVNNFISNINQRKHT